jgi:hypothetical protein
VLFSLADAGFVVTAWHEEPGELFSPAANLSEYVASMWSRGVTSPFWPSRFRPAADAVLARASGQAAAGSASNTADVELMWIFREAYVSAATSLAAPRWVDGVSSSARGGRDADREEGTDTQPVAGVRTPFVAYYVLARPC